MADDTTTSTEDVLGTDDAQAPEETTTPAETPAEEANITQAQLNRILADEKRKWQSKHADYKDLKAKAARLEELEAEQLTEQEKLQKEVATLRDQLNKSTEEQLKTLRQNAILQEAAKLNFADPGDAFVQLINDDSITIEDGKVQGVEAAVKSLAETKPYLIKNQQAGGLESFNPAGKARNAENDAQKLARLYNQTQGSSPIG